MYRMSLRLVVIIIKSHYNKKMFITMKKIIAITLESLQ